MNVEGMVMEMKLQRAVRLDMDRHTEAEAEELVEKGIAMCSNGYYMVFLEDMERIEVEVDDYGWLMNVAYTIEGDRVPVKF